MNLHVEMDIPCISALDKNSSTHRTPMECPIFSTIGLYKLDVG